MIGRALFVITFAAVAAGCNGGGTNPPLFFTGTAAPTVTPTPTLQHLYVGNSSTLPVVEINRYDLPITSIFQGPSLALNPPAPGLVLALGLDAAGNLGVGLIDGTLLFYNAPLSGASTPAARFPNGNAWTQTQIAFTAAGDLFAAAGNRVNVFTHPFSNASTPSSITNPALYFTGGVVLDAAQNLYIANTGNGAGSNLFVYARPYSRAPTITALVPGTSYRGPAAISATQLFVTSPPGQVDVYNLPITAASVPAFSITNGVNFPTAAAVDAAGNLYLSNFASPILNIYAPPFSAVSSPAMRLGVYGCCASLMNPGGSAGFAISTLMIGK